MVGVLGSRRGGSLSHPPGLGTTPTPAQTVSPWAQSGVTRVTGVTGSGYRRRREPASQLVGVPVSGPATVRAADPPRTPRWSSPTAPPRSRYQSARPPGAGPGPPRRPPAPHGRAARRGRGAGAPPGRRRPVRARRRALAAVGARPRRGRAGAHAGGGGVVRRVAGRGGRVRLARPGRGRRRRLAPGHAHRGEAAGGVPAAPRRRAGPDRGRLVGGAARPARPGRTISLRVEADEEELLAGSVRLVLQVLKELYFLDLRERGPVVDRGPDDHGFGDLAYHHAAIALRAAAQAWPVLDRLLELRVPDEITLDTDELVSLLDEGVAALRRAGVDHAVAAQPRPRPDDAGHARAPRRWAGRGSGQGPGRPVDDRLVRSRRDVRLQVAGRAPRRAPQ